MIYKPLTTNSTTLIIEDIKEHLKEDLPDQVTIDTWDLAHLIGEIERLKDDNKYLNKVNIELSSEKNILRSIIKEVRNQLDYLETYSSKEDVFEDMKIRLYRIDKIIRSDKE